VGETGSDGRLSNAPRRRASGRLAARSIVSRFGRDRRGTTAVEYGLIIALVFLVIVASVSAFGNKTTNLMNTLSNTIGHAIGM